MSWQDRAACDGQPVNLFFPDRGQSDKRAKEICQKCPVTQECLDLARRNERDSARFGIYGGLTADERQRLFGSEYNEQVY